MGVGWGWLAGAGGSIEFTEEIIQFLLNDFQIHIDGDVDGFHFVFHFHTTHTSTAKQDEPKQRFIHKN